MVRALKEEPKIALELAVIGGEHDVEVLAPTLDIDRSEHATDGFVDEFVLDMGHRVDFANLIGGKGCRNPLAGSFVIADELSVVPKAPVTWFGIDDRFAFGLVLRITDRKIEFAPVDAMQFGFRWIPRVVRIRETHPAEPVVFAVQTIEPRDRSIGNPIGVVPIARNRVVFDLRSARVAAGNIAYFEITVEHLEEHADCFWMVLADEA
ncbi:unannotated protein [freshwater metagenome]|uniref:Unannotated protein n=1 Tax=freshwater metagenome TaxID=449393 RepID=A0A6J6RUJ0_9ZZZZ